MWRVERVECFFKCLVRRVEEVWRVKEVERFVDSTISIIASKDA